MDQAALYRRSNPQLASRIVTSVLKDVDVAVLRAIGAARRGALSNGGAESLGLAEGGASCATNVDARAAAPPAVLKTVDAARVAVIAGRVHVPSAFDEIAGAGEPDRVEIDAVPGDSRGTR